MYNPQNLEVSSELLLKFNAQAHEAANEIEFDVHNEREIFIKGYVAACSSLFLKNKGIQPIPYPVSLSTVDMICITIKDGDIQVLMGRKPKQEKWQFPGGFRDPKETSRQAAARELSEEASLFNIDQTHYCYRIQAGVQSAYSRLESIDELFVDDIRYRESPHKITTHVFLLELTEEEKSLPKAGDDLGEVCWYSMKEMCEDSSFIRDIHLPIFELLKKYLFGTH